VSVTNSEINIFLNLDGGKFAVCYIGVPDMNSLAKKDDCFSEFQQCVHGEATALSALRSYHGGGNYSRPHTHQAPVGFHSYFVSALIIHHVNTRAT
jgi:hypothetical protein